MVLAMAMMDITVCLILCVLTSSITVDAMLDVRANQSSSLQKSHARQGHQESEQVNLGLRDLPFHWPQVSEQSWPDHIVGPDNYKYFFLGAVPAGTKELRIDLKKHWNTESGPLLCLRRGGPPLPSKDISLSLPAAARAAGGTANSSFLGACAPFTRNVHLALTPAEVLEGPWWLALFTDPSDTRTQSKMIQRGPTYAFSMNVTVAGCGSQQDCPLTQESSTPGVGTQSQQDHEATGARPSSSSPGGRVPSSFLAAALHEGQSILSTLESSLFWSNAAPAGSVGTSAPGLPPAAVVPMERQCYSWTHSFPVYVAPGTATLSIALDLLPSPESASQPQFCALLRWGALPVRGLVSAAGQVRLPATGFTGGRLEGQLPNARAGWWYLQIGGQNETGDGHFCVRAWEVTASSCGEGRAGPGCAWPLERLQRVLTGPTFAATYRPSASQHTPDGWFPLDLTPPSHLASPAPAIRVKQPGGGARNASSGAGGQWAYLLFAVPESAAGQTLTLEARWPASGGASRRVHLFTKLGAVPAEDDYDFAAAFNRSDKATGDLNQGAGTHRKQHKRRNGTKNHGNDDTLSKGNTLTNPRNDQSSGRPGSDAPLLLWGPEKDSVQLIVQYPAAGAWYAGLLVAPLPQGSLQAEPEPPPLGLQNAVAVVEVRVRVGGCPQDCSGHGSCGTYFDQGYAHVWSTCECDRTHGGAACSVEVLSPAQESRHVLALTLSNAAAIPAAAWAITHQAYPEWVVFTTGGLASAVYHLCDAGSTCLAQYGTLQFADFLLSFLAVILTCLALAPLPPSATAAVQLSAALLLAMLAKDNATSGWSLVAVAALGGLALLLGWGLEAILTRHPRQGDSSAPCRSHWHDLVAVPRARCPLLPLSPRAVLAWFSRRYRWPYLVAGLAMLGLAAAAWTFEAGATYWIWHSWWHVSIFLCPFFLLSATTPPHRRKAPAAQSYVTLEGTEQEAEAALDERELRVIVQSAEPVPDHQPIRSQA